MAQLTQIKSAEFAFCRYGVMILAWLAFLLKIQWIVVLIFVIMLLSAIFTVKYAPMILLWRYTVGLVYKGKSEVLNVTAMRVAHSAGAVLSGICVVLLYAGFYKAGWIAVGVLAIMKTISALGFCPASKLYVCMSSGGCCAFSKAIAPKK